MTVVGPTVEVTQQEMADRVTQTREKHGDLLQKYHQAWYESGHTWVYTHFCGIGVMKCPNDMWIYQDLISRFRPKTIIETGTYGGGSALWFAFIMDLLHIDEGRIYSIDIENRRQCDHPRIAFIEHDSTDPGLADDLRKVIQYPLLVSLDADHSAEHVYKELSLYAPMCRVGDWCVVEDTNIAWGGEGGDLGARGGLQRYVEEHPGEFVQDVLCERYLLTMHPGGWLQRVAEAP